ncbi:MAG: hypothetical protein RR312_03865 [Bacteroidales bacterium]
MNRTEQKNTENEKSGRKIGLALTVIVHASLFLVFFNAGFKVIYPPPTEKGILLEFEQDIEIKPIEVKAGNEPRAKTANPKADIRLVQKSEGQAVGTKPNKGKEVTMGDNGDVPKYEPPRKKAIDKRALFSSANNKTDTLAPQTADRISAALKAGHPAGNTRVGEITGTPSARLQGRNVMGALPFPSYTIDKAGKVVVKIMVDQYGKVTNAIAGVQGTTVQDKTLWEAARQAALKAQFNVSSSAAVVQEGTITYVFKLQ